MKKYPDRLPIYIQSTSKDVVIEKNKLLMNKDYTVGQVLCIIRSKLIINSDKAIFLLDESGQLPMTSQLLSDLYHERKNKDGCLYLSVSIETTFG